MITRRKCYGESPPNRKRKQCDLSPACSSSCSSTCASQRKRRKRYTMTNQLDKSMPQRFVLKVNCNPASSTGSSSRKSSHSRRKTRSGSVSYSENWYLSLCMAMSELVKQKFLTLPEVTRMENLPSGLFQNEATARVFLAEKKLQERVAMIKDIFDAADAVEES